MSLNARHIEIMFDVNNFDNVEVPTATTFRRRITSRLKKQIKCLLDVRD
jgi:hypothetical protein